MLKLQKIVKNYIMGDNKVEALKGVDIEFRENEFVSILGPSGCGKTTMLNIIGGLDRYTSGDLLINGKSTNNFTENEWDSYRNNVIGFVFQNYNLIAHLTVLDNVEIALTLSGVSYAERKKRAKDMLVKVGLSDQIHKNPNQLSGGQMQRVAIARSLINNPKIMLADEPTGALDSVTSLQIMELLKEISKDRLVIMVTHNQEIADKYSTRIIRLTDGEITGDSSPYNSNINEGAVKTKIQKYSGKKTSMTFLTALKLSFNNLKTKKMRTIITAIAGSIGITGIALVLAISSGMTGYIDKMQSDMLAGFPLTVPQTATSLNLRDMMNNKGNANDFTKEDVIYPYSKQESPNSHKNNFNEEFLTYLNGLDSSLYNSISYVRGLNMNLVIKTPQNQYKQAAASNLNWQELPPGTEFVNSQYDILAGNYPAGNNDLILIVDEQNQIDSKLLNDLGIQCTNEQTFKFEDFIGWQIKQVNNNNYYSFNSETGLYQKNDNELIYNNANVRTLTITGVMRVKESAAASILNRGIGYMSTLTDEVLASCQNSDIVMSQKDNTINNVISGINFTDNNGYKATMLILGGDSTPLGISIYPKSFAAKESIKAYIDSYNADKEESDKIIYQDLAEVITEAFGTLVNTITLVLSAFAAISLVVSSIMIGIITYVSVVERTKEIGILRSIGARKKDISRVFNAETIIIGFSAGVLGIAATLIFSIPLNIIIKNLVDVENIARLPLLSAIILVLVSVTLTFIAGLIPSRIAANKDPVAALRTE